MWRSGVALILLIGLVVLVGSLWLGGSDGATGHGPRIRIAGGAVPPSAPSPAADGDGVSGDQPEAPAEPVPAADLPVPAYVVRDPGGSGVTAPPPQDFAELSQRPPAEDALWAWQDERTGADPAESEAAAGRGEPDNSRIIPPGVPRPPQVALVVPVPRPVQAQKALIANVQQRLATLGYIVSIDGRSGMRTEAAVREFQKNAKLPVDGLITEPLLGQLDAAIRARAEARQQVVEVVPAAPAAPERKRGVLGSVLGGFQRLLGQDFDGIKRPAEMAAYCRSNADTWIYDFGREAFVYCGNVNANSLLTHGPAKPAAEAAGR